MTNAVDQLDAAWFTKFRRNLKRWYSNNARDLPWRRTHDAYCIWISEIMLQQTTVAAVIPYYQRFLKRFPTVQSLAAANEQDVLKLWEGLGYYSRARNIHKAAKIVATERGGEFPQTADELQDLPGIGRYTAGAIASFAFDSRAPIVEANTLRLYCRLLAFDGDPRSKEGQNLLWQFADRVLPRMKPGEFNQALMELGGTLCSVKQPECQKCPVRRGCRAFQENRQAEIPRPKSRPKVTESTHANLIVRRRNKILIRQHTADERWSGLWDYPRYELGNKLVASILPVKKGGPGLFQIDAAVCQSLSESLRSDANIEADIGEPIMELTHSVTRYRIRLICFDATYRSGRTNSRAATKWVCIPELDEYPLTMTARKIAGRLAN